jgi:nucleoside-diphosphate-sugar epimerase
MRLLVIGGTSFVGRTLVSDALGRGHEVTTFNRGLTGKDVDGVEALRGDRSNDEGVLPLAGRSFDAVLDPGGLIPAQVLRTARAMAGSAPFYAFISTTAVYQAWDTARLDESAVTWHGAPDQDGDPADLGKLRVHKRGCELAVEQTYGPGACLIARPGSIVGPHDNLGQLPWWLTRIAAGDRLGRHPGVDGRELPALPGSSAVGRAPAMDPGRAGHRRFLGRAGRLRESGRTAPPPFGLASGKEQQVLAAGDFQPPRDSSVSIFVRRPS